MCFSLKFCDFSELCQFCCSAGVYNIYVYICKYGIYIIIILFKLAIISNRVFMFVYLLICSGKRRREENRNHKPAATCIIKISTFFFYFSRMFYILKSPFFFFVITKIKINLNLSFLSSFLYHQCISFFIYIIMLNVYNTNIF